MVVSSAGVSSKVHCIPAGHGGFVDGSVGYFAFFFLLLTVIIKVEITRKTKNFDIVQKLNENVTKLDIKYILLTLQFFYFLSHQKFVQSLHNKVIDAYNEFAFWVVECHVDHLNWFELIETVF